MLPNAWDVPSALAFLEFLRDRGASTLPRPSAADRRRAAALEPDTDDDDPLDDEGPALGIR